MRTDGGIDGKQVVLFSPKQFALKLSGSRIFMSVHVRFFFAASLSSTPLPEEAGASYLVVVITRQLFSVIFDVLLICY